MVVNCIDIEKKQKARNTGIGQRGECACLLHKAHDGEVKKSEAGTVEDAQTKKELGMMNALPRTWTSLWPSWGEALR